MAVDMALAATAYSVANSLGATPKVMLSLFEAALVESGFRNLDYGDRDSVGYLQQRPSQGWPNPTDPKTATTSYVKRALANEKKHPTYTAGQLAQSVQISASPDKYDKREKEAKALITSVSDGKGVGSILDSLPGVITPGDLVDGVNLAANALKTMATGVVNVGGLATQLTKLALPSNVVRAAAGGLGIIFLFTGIVIIGKQVKQ
jgi:hypothetical protein